MNICFYRITKLVHFVFEHQFQVRKIGYTEIILYESGRILVIKYSFVVMISLSLRLDLLRFRGWKIR